MSNIPNLALKRWLVAVASLRLLSVYLGVFDAEKLAAHLFDLQPSLVTPLYGRTFATWTLLTCIICLLCSKYPHDPSIYGITLTSFVIALLHIGSEAVLFRTVSFKAAISPVTIAVSMSSFVVILQGFPHYGWEQVGSITLLKAIGSRKTDSEKEQR